MSKKSYPRRLGESEAKASVRTIQTTPRKVNLLAGLIRGKTAQAAKAELAFSRRRVASEVLKALDSAIANAENNFGAKARDLVIESVLIGPGPSLKRSRPRAKGSASAILKRSSHITVVVTDGKPVATLATKAAEQALEQGAKVTKSEVETKEAPKAKSAVSKKEAK